MNGTESVYSQLCGYPEFRAFCKTQRIPLDIYSDILSTHSSVHQRYLVLNPFRYNPVDEFHISGVGAWRDVPWISAANGCRHLKVLFADDSAVSVAQNQLYRDGVVLSCDISSILCVLVLDVARGMHVLDTCCAPGMKTVLNSICLHHSRSTAVDLDSDMSMVTRGFLECDLQGYYHIRKDREQIQKRARGFLDGGSVTAVDLSQNRFFSCRSILKRYGVRRARLFRGDGTEFSVGPLSALERKSKRQTQKSAWISKVMIQDSDYSYLSGPPRGYDRVLVDAECTHDGSVAHIFKHADSSDPDSLRRWVHGNLSPEKVKSIIDVQRRLIENGYRMLEPGGYLVYSTCSLSVQQNEEVVAWFLDVHPEAALIDVHSEFERMGVRVPQTPKHIIDSFRSLAIGGDVVLRGIWEKTKRFFAVPLEGGWSTSGFFIAKIWKPATRLSETRPAVQELEMETGC